MPWFCAQAQVAAVQCEELWLYRPGQMGSATIAGTSSVLEIVAARQLSALGAEANAMTVKGVLAWNANRQLPGLLPCYHASHVCSCWFRSSDGQDISFRCPRSVYASGAPPKETFRMQQRAQLLCNRKVRTRTSG
eukprot:CAMPEP_0206140790 /NCGR_PEP_ID=MMETSP1473-20131121/10645_1 /ASSEMBLY_ACC=CAM_ASM_001109 /TAXON_ID=1461547 /ORGANISM="Stichococcus sp, Strain RCC1054" /LENGTH=134 /DNA_ID=CAMNT_0053535075 /DNA_START=2775 /DNA_END=3177 /DNA_ORIENTATION=+